jgi:hypothetical protein
MSNIMLGVGNRFNEAACALSGGSWIATTSISLANLKDRDLDKVARTNDALAASSKINVDLGGTYAVGVFALVNHNLSSAATIRIRTSSVSLAACTSAPNFDSGTVNALQMTFTVLPALWGADYMVHRVFTAATSVRYMLIEISDTANAAGYIQIGRLFLSTTFQPTINAQHGLKDARQDLSTVDVAMSGKEFAMERRRRRTVAFSLEHMTQAEADRLHEIDSEIGLTDEILYVPDPANYPLSQRYGFLGLQRELSALDYPQFGSRGKGISLKQKL